MTLSPLARQAITRALATGDPDTLFDVIERVCPERDLEALAAIAGLLAELDALGWKIRNIPAASRTPAVRQVIAAAHDLDDCLAVRHGRKLLAT